MHHIHIEVFYSRKAKFVTNLHNIPGYEYAIILGAYCLTTEWKPSRQLVCACGEACLIPFTKEGLVSDVHILS
jgi:hypothetical protein